jgi:hypothetical protein
MRRKKNKASKSVNPQVLPVVNPNAAGIDIGAKEQKLHSFGLLNGSFRPDQQIRKLRTYMRLRDNLVVASTQAVHHMQKALFEMNVQLSN